MGVAPLYVLQGRVYEGDTGLEPPNSTPLQGVTVHLYCANNAFTRGTLLRSTTTDSEGWYGLDVYGGDVCEYFNIVEIDPLGYISNGASTVGGNVITANWIEYSVPLRDKTLTGNKFWDRRQTTNTPAPTPPPTATPTPTKTPTLLPTPVPTTPGAPLLTPTFTATPTISAGPTPTPSPSATPVAPTPTPTSTWPPSCTELLVNGDFEGGTLLPWNPQGAIGLGPGHVSAYGVWLGDADNAVGELSQEVNIPTESYPVTLSFWWLAESSREQSADAIEVIIQHAAHDEHLLTLPAVAPLGKWRQETLDLSPYAGETVTLTFFVHTDQVDPSLFRLDDIRLQACGSSLPGGGYRMYLPIIATRRPLLR